MDRLINNAIFSVKFNEAQLTKQLPAFLVRGVVLLFCFG